MFRKFIERPVLSTVISIILLILGILSVFNLPLSLFPEIAPPSVQVTAFYPGANAEVVARSVAVPIEEAVNGVEDMTYMTSSSSSDGNMILNVYFKQGTDVNIAAVNVQDRVSKAESQLPQEVVQAGLATQKVQNSMVMFMGLYSEDPEMYNEEFIHNYIRINILPQIQRIPGVARAQMFGSSEYSMRLWLNPERLTANSLTPQEVIEAVQKQNLEAAPGKFGQNSKETFEYTLKYKGKFNQPKQYENIIIKANLDGSILRLKDVARVELGSYTYTTTNRVNGKPAAGFAIQQAAGSNANEMIDQVEKTKEEFLPKLPKGLKPAYLYHAKEFLDASILQVVETLIIAFILVFLVVYLFLQDLRSTLIPAIAVPVAIIGTFFFLQLLGYTINMLTLFALVLAIGIVVDDAIVVVEAVHAKMNNSNLNAKEASVESMNEISGAIISITLVMAAVFVPVGFLEGPTGVFYRQFGFTLAIAIFISAINALTLSPALCALFLKSGHHSSAATDGNRSFAKRFFTAFNASFNHLNNRYVGGVRFLVRRKWLALGILSLIFTGCAILLINARTGFIPEEDNKIIGFSVNTPPGTSFDRTAEKVAEIENMIKDDEAIENLWITDGQNAMGNTFSSSFSNGFIRLKDIEKRGENPDVSQLMEKLTQKASKVQGATTFFFAFPTVQGFGNSVGFEFMLQDRASGSLDDLEITAQQFTNALKKRKEIGSVFTTFSTRNPQYEFAVDFDKAGQLGVDVSELMRTLQIYYGSSFVSDFNRFGKYYRVMAQADAVFRENINSLDGIFVKNKFGEMVPVKTLVTFERTHGPETVTRNNLFNSVMFNGTPKPGFSSGDAIRAIKETATESLPRGYMYELTGITREEAAAGSQAVLIFMLSIIFVYFLLAAQYESYILPLSIILSIPTGVLGVYGFTGMAGIDNNIYVQLGLIMLIGLLSKNGILIVEFAVQMRRSGIGIIESALEASRLRLRPIIMTSFAFIVGMLPLIWATRGAANGNHSIGISTVGGMLTGVTFGIFIIPVLYIIFQYLHEKVSVQNNQLPKTNNNK
ncbi:efflux RND transporter permease subunit [Chryseobacterium sp. 09-1422]|uniref:Efflux RND transporter permease subunit n=1 Tax=Chryseobacterium kimseyorum TaxID=2984028 RepID=A0ABT3I3M1_9FLAO|nr:efflux RND transporter permease subunit [Chryseobacterium kimseyorum]MCW3170672.1 efflux RND transporter permease subunit [Chryseobacterium kimseyorum]